MMTWSTPSAPVFAVATTPPWSRRPAGAPWSAPTPPAPAPRRVAFETLDFLPSSLPGATLANLGKLGTMVGHPEISSILEKIRQAQTSQSAGGIPGFDQQQVQAAILDAIRTGKVDSKAIFGNVLGVGAGAICAATGVGAGMVPICAAGGKALGQMLAGFTVHPDGALPTASSQAFQNAMDADREYLNTTRQDLFFRLSSQMKSQETRDKALQILDNFFPLATDFGVGTAEYQDTLPEYLGFYTPFAWECTAGKAFHDLCGTVYDWEMDFSGPPLKPGWAEATLNVIQQKLEAKGIPVGPNFDILRQENAKSPRWYGRPQSEELFQFYQDVKRTVWPLMQSQMEQQLQDLLVSEAIKGNQEFLSSVDELSSQLLWRAKCGSDDTDCSQKVLQQVALYTEQLHTLPVEQVASQINADFPPPVTTDDTSGQGSKDKDKDDEGIHWGRWLLGALTLGALGAGGYRVSQGLPVLPEDWSHPLR